MTSKKTTLEQNEDACLLSRCKDLHK